MKHRQNQLTRLLSKLIANPQTGCMEWSAWRQPNGYGQAFYNGRLMPAHRAVYMAVKNVDLNRSQFVCHKCDNPPCCNPDHMFIGGACDNMQDMVAKGRHVSVTKPHTFPRGSKCHLSKLTDGQVDEIRRLIKSGLGSTEIFKMGRFPISRSGISKIKNNQSRKV